MSENIVWFLLGLFIGANVGFLITAVIVGSNNNNED